MSVFTIIAICAAAWGVFTAGVVVGLWWASRSKDEEERRLDDLEDEEEFLAGLETKYATQH